MCNDAVLFVDDDVVSSLLNCAILRESGFEVVEARSFTEACDVIETRPHLLALVTDIDLGGADGFEVARIARMANPDLPVLYMSGTDLHRYAKEGVRESRFIPKPFNPDQIVRALDEATRLTPAQLEGPRALAGRK